MKPPSISGIVDVGLDVLNSEVDDSTNRILIQTGDVVNETTDSDQVEWWQHLGFVSRPPKPKPGEAATQVVVLQTSDRDVAIGSIDHRTLRVYGNLKPGETCMFGPGEDGTAQGRVIIKNDGSVNVYTTADNTEDGEAVYFRVAPDGFSFVAPWGTLKFDATGFHVNHTSGSQVSLGGIYGLPAPMDQISSYARIQAGTFNVNSSVQSMGGVAGHNPLANAEAVKAAVAALQAQVQALSAAVVALGADPTGTNPATGAAVSAAKVAVEGQSKVATAAVTQLPTTTAST